MRRPYWVTKSGPYSVMSMTNGTLRIVPRWPQYSEWNEDDGGGPGLFGRMGLATAFENWLNATYPSEEVRAWTEKGAQDREDYWNFLDRKRRRDRKPKSDFAKSFEAFVLKGRNKRLKKNPLVARSQGAKETP